MSGDKKALPEVRMENTRVVKVTRVFAGDLPPEFAARVVRRVEVTLTARGVDRTRALSELVRGETEQLEADGRHAEARTTCEIADLLEWLADGPPGIFLDEPAEPGAPST